MMRHLPCCVLLVHLAVGCDDFPISDAGTDAGSDAGIDAGVDAGRFDAGSDTGVRGDSGPDVDGSAGAGSGGGGSPAAGAGGVGGAEPQGGAGGEPDPGGVGGSEAGSGGGEAPDAGTPGEDAAIDGGVDPAPTLEFVSFEGVQVQIPTGQTIRAKALWRNPTSTAISISQALITAREPGATHESGPFDDFTPTANLVTVAAGATLEVSASLLPRAVLGEWEAYPTYLDDANAWHDAPGVKFQIVADHDYGSYDNTIWPIADPSDAPNDDRRFAYACYTKSPSDDDSAVCRARYGLGTLPYQVNPDNLPSVQQQCEQDGGVFLIHACPTNQMLQLCWEDTRSPAWSFRCEYYGDPDNKSPQQPGSAPDIVFYNDGYLGRDP